MLLRRGQTGGQTDRIPKINTSLIGRDKKSNDIQHNKITTRVNFHLKNRGVVSMDVQHTQLFLFERM
jgi:hypothetical protein